MTCARCHSLMVQDRAYDLLDTNIHCDIWRCVCCGYVVDHRILLHQRTVNPRRHHLKEASVQQVEIAA